LERACLDIARSYGIRLIGPNCIGLLDTHLPINATFLPPPGPPPGDVAFVSHSGAICAAVIDWARGQGFGMSRLVSLGNQVDVNETDVLEPLIADPFTRVLTLYLEGVSDGRRFIEKASRVTRQKPVIALKVGRYAGGRRAVASHTGALAGQENAFNAGFRRAGVIRADTSEEVFDWARALAWCPPPHGRDIAVLTNAGGPGVTAADALESEGMRLAELGEATVAALTAALPPAASLGNPVDMLASAAPEQYALCLRILLEDPGVDGALVILPPPPMYTAGAVAKALIPVIHNAEKPVVIALMGERLIPEAIEHFRAARVAEYRFPERAASALAVLAQRAEYLERAVNSTPVPCDRLSAVDHAAIQAILDSADHQPRDFLAQDVVYRLLEAYGIPTPAARLVSSPEQAAATARELGFPVVLKVASPDILHKSEVGGVLLNLVDEASVRLGFERLVARAHELRPEAHILGAHVQRMIQGGQEVIVGAVQDLQFGPLVMFGSGGVEVEGLKDVAFSLAPITEEETEYLLRSTWAGRRLGGYRSLQPADRQAVIESLRCIGQMAVDFPQIAEIEINPLRVMPAGEGVLAVDARLRLADADNGKGVRVK
jgi:acyl-CoA synthetase (NDP forming)